MGGARRVYEQSREVYSAHSNAWHLVQDCGHAQHLVQEVKGAVISQQWSAGVLT